MSIKERTYIMVKVRYPRWSWAYAHVYQPDGVQRGLVGKIIQRFEERGYKLIALKLVHTTKEHLEKRTWNVFFSLIDSIWLRLVGNEDYQDLKGKPFFPGLIDYMASGPVVGMVWQGLDAVKTGRAMLGATNPLQSPVGKVQCDLWICRLFWRVWLGTIRGDYCLAVGRNICHGSDSVENAEKEIALWVL